MRTLVFAFTGLLLASATPLAAVTLGQKDTFSDGSTQGWLEGPVSPNPPTNIATGGPVGVGDRYLQNISGGGFGAGSRMIMFNSAQWTGNYTAAGISRIEADMANFGSTTLNMRIGLKSGIDEYVSSNAAVLPADGHWYHVSFDLHAGSLLQVAGTNPLAVVLGAVQQVRILSNAIADFDGEAIVGTLGVDNITARIPGDINGDGFVNVGDLQALVAAWASQASPPSGNWNPNADVNNDGFVNVGDLQILVANWGRSS